MMRFFLLVSLSLLLGGCGFHLHGMLEHAPPSAHFASDKPYDQFSKQVKRDLNRAHVTLDPHSPYSIHILDTHMNERRTSVSSSTQVRQYVLSFTVHYQFDNQHPAIPRHLTVTRNYTRDESQMLGSSNEQYTIVREMHREASQRLLRQFVKAYETQVSPVISSAK